MTNINFPSSGGSSVLSYVISDCLGADSISFVASDNWYSLVHDISARTVTITVQSSLSDSARTSDIIVSINGNSCPSKNVVIIQDGLLPCDCNSFVDFSQLLFEIDASGMTSGTVVGTYSLLGSNCDDEDISFDVSVITPESGQYYGGSFDLVAINGNIILASDVIANLNSGMTTFDVDIYYGDSKCRSFSVVQDGTEVTCDCTYKELLLKKAHQYFSNQPYSSSNHSYTPLTNVLIASGSTACGTFYVGEIGEGISSAWTETDDAHVYVYANIEPNNSGLGRSMPVNIYYTPKKEYEENSDDTCENPFTIALHQSNSEYFNCNYLLSLDYCNYKIFGKSSYYGIFARSYDYMSYASLNNVKMLNVVSESKGVILTPRVEIGYCDLVKFSTSSWEIENEEPITNIDPYDIVELTYNRVTNGFSVVKIRFKTPNSPISGQEWTYSATTKSRYAKVYFDLYTDYGNIYCCTCNHYYLVQGPYQCCDCNSIIHSNEQSISSNIYNASSVWSSDTYSYMVCNYGAYLDSVEVVPSSAGTILSTTADTITGGIAKYEYQINENNGGSMRFVSIVETIKCDPNSDGCAYKRYTFRQQKNTCECSEMLSKISFNGSVEVSGEITGDCKSSSFSVERINNKPAYINTKIEIAPYISTIIQDFCPSVDAYMVLCDASGNPKDMSTYMSSDGYIMGECSYNKNGFKFKGYDSNKNAFRIQHFFVSPDDISSIKLEYPITNGCHNEYHCYPSYYFYIDFYNKNDDSFVCSSKDNFGKIYVYNKQRAIKIITPTGDCKCDFDCNTFSGFNYQIDTAFTTCMKDGEEHIIVPSGQSSYIVATFNHYNGEDLTNFGICSDVGTFIYSVSSTTSDVSCDIVNGNQLRVNVGEFTSQTQRLFTCDIHYGYASAFGGTTYCVDRYLTVYFLQCGNEYENCSCSNES